MTALKRLQARMNESDADGILVSSEINAKYLSGFDFSDGYLLIKNDRATLITDSRYAEAAQNSVSNFEIVSPQGNRGEALCELIKQQGISTIAIEEDSLSYSDFLRFEKLFPCTLKAGASSVISSLRRKKTPEEIAKTAKAQEITDMAFEHILGFISTDRTEVEIALELEFFMRSHGASGIAFDTIAVSGSASSLPHGVPASVKLRKGFLTMDFGAKFDGYCSDMTRTVCIGRADEEMKKVYSTVLEAQERALEGIREGMPCRVADALARDVIRNAGFGSAFGHSLGHGVGLYIHESPSLSPYADESSVLKKGNIVTVEPGIYLEGRFGVRIEDMIAIDHNGSVLNFTKSPKKLLEI